MTWRTYEANAENIETADDLDNLVQNKGERCRANSSKACLLYTSDAADE